MQAQAVPNRSAVALRARSTGAIAIYMPTEVTRFAFHMDFAFGAAERARELGLDLILLAVGGETDTVRPRADGLLVLESLRGDAAVSRLRESGIPTVHVGRHHGPGRDPDGVIVVDHRGMMLALLDHLRERGARRIGMLGPRPEFDSDWGLAIPAAYDEWCAGHCAEPLVEPVAALLDPAEVDRAVRRLVVGSGIDGLVGALPGTAVRALQSLSELGHEPGVDVLVASGVAERADALTTPALTTIELHPRVFGRNSVEFLIEMLDGRESAPAARRHPAELVIRVSTAGKPG